MTGVQTCALPICFPVTIRAFWTAEYNKGEKISDTKAGKTVAWINYMTNFNKTFGEFAAGESEDFMVMNRNYERDEENDSLISDLSTYIDPSKYNQIFADTSLSAQNFWVQTAVQIEVRQNIINSNNHRNGYKNK